MNLTLDIIDEVTLNFTCKEVRTANENKLCFRMHMESDIVGYNMSSMMSFLDGVETTEYFSKDKTLEVICKAIRVTYLIKDTPWSPFTPMH